MKAFGEVYLPGINAAKARFAALPSADRIASLLGPAKPYLAIVGTVSVTYVVLRTMYSFFRGSLSYFLAGPLRLGVNFRKLTKDGGWAVVTGASDGLGLAFARELARRGVNVILVGRNAEKLDMVAREIEFEFHVKADMLIINLLTATVEDYVAMRQRLAQIQVDILVNTVGMTAGSSGTFGSVPKTEQLCHDMLHVNVMSMLTFTNAVIAGMKERRRGVIVNLSSIAAVYPLPHYALYGATKAMVDFFSAALFRECRKHGIIVQSVLAGPVLTNLTRNFAKSFFLVQAGPFARDTLSQVGFRRRTFGHWIHALMMTIARPIPLWIMLRFLQPRSPTTRD